MLTLAGVVVVTAGTFGVYQVAALQRAHSTFDNYYAFRGCVQLLQRTPDYGVCRTNAGQTIKIVEFRSKWYLDNDLPTCIGGACF